MSLIEGEQLTLICDECLKPFTIEVEAGLRNTIPCPHCGAIMDVPRN